MEDRWLDEDETPDMVVDMPKLAAPCVYIFEAEDGTPLYIGRSLTGSHRPFSSRHHAAFCRGKTVRLIPFQTTEAAKLAEAALIHEYHPEHNGVCYAPRCRHYSHAAEKSQPTFGPPTRFEVDAEINAALDRVRALLVHRRHAERKAEFEEEAALMLRRDQLWEDTE